MAQVISRNRYEAMPKDSVSKIMANCNKTFECLYGREVYNQKSRSIN